MHTTKLIVNNNVNVSKTTSTPIKCNIQESVCDISSIQNNSHENVKEVRVDTNGAQEEPKEEVLPQIPQPTNIEEVLKCDNDNNALKQYVSPLDSKNRLVLSPNLFNLSRMYTNEILSGIQWMIL